jgi:hypothetical protein
MPRAPLCFSVKVERRRLNGLRSHRLFTRPVWAPFKIRKIATEFF